MNKYPLKYTPSCKNPDLEGISGVLKFYLTEVTKQNSLSLYSLHFSLYLKPRLCRLSLQHFEIQVKS